MNIYKFAGSDLELENKKLSCNFLKMVLVMAKDEKAARHILEKKLKHRIGSPTFKLISTLALDEKVGKVIDEYVLNL